MESILYREDLLEDAIELNQNGQSIIGEQGLESYVYTNFPELVPHNQKENYKKKWQKQWVLNELLVQEWNRVRASLAIKKIRPIALKGVALIPEFYSDLGSRRMCDVDFLITPDEVEETRNVLITEGFKELESEKWKANNFKYLFSKTVSGVELILEIHTRLFYHSDIRIIETTPYEWGERLSSELQFIHLAGHLAFQHTFSQMYWLIDVWNFYKNHKDEINWRLVKSQATELKLYRSIQMCLWVISEIFEENIPEEVEKMYELDMLSFWKMGLTTDFILRPRKSLTHYMWVKFFTKDDLSESLNYFGGWFKNFLLRKTKKKKLNSKESE